ncbi:hypothetical protein [Rhodococcus sp. BS-15]|uniref:hypothetical protein n=1 Tax=Rhodococcus sp. BS-15 TaxID=1304954 RepID=UPI001F3227E1|nr:hypothetical protein [Rhodococcus sp. BS-15]
MSKSDEHDRYRVKSLVGFDEMAEGVLARSTMHADYVDHFFVDVDTAAAPERYARVMFGDVPSVAERFIWQGLLQLRLIAGPTPTSSRDGASQKLLRGGFDWKTDHIL